MNAPLLTGAIFWPMFLRYPKRGQTCPYTGWGISQFDRAKNSGRVEAHMVTVPGKKRGVVMFDALSVYRYIKSFPMIPAKPNQETHDFLLTGISKAVASIEPETKKIISVIEADKLMSAHPIH